MGGAAVEDVCDGLLRMRRFGRSDVVALEDVLVEARAFVPETERDFETGGDDFALLGVEARYDKRVYLADAETLLDVVREAGNADTVLLAGTTLACRTSCSR